MSLLSKSVNACGFVVAFTNKIPCEASVSQLVILLSPLLEKNFMRMKAPVLLLLCLRYKRLCIEILISSEPITRKSALIILVCLFFITEIDDLDAIVPAVKKLKILSY